MKLGKLLAAIKQELPVTPRHEKWLAANPNASYSAAAKEFLAAEIGKPGRDRSRAFSASGAHTCHRRRMFSFLGLPESEQLASRTIQIFHNGTYMHLRWQMAGITAGWLATPEAFFVNAPLRLKGSLDGILDTGEGLELKSINSNGFNYVMSAGKPKKAHIGQVASYFVMTDLEKFSIIYENKDTQDYREFVVTRKDAPVDEALTELEKLNTHVEYRELPEIKDLCWAGQGTEYLQCPFREICPTIKDWEHAEQLTA